MAIPYFQHDYLSKPKLTRPDAAANHLSYLLRKPECIYSYSERFTITDGASKSKRNMQAFLNRRTEELRANGRVCDKFIIALPVELTLDDWAKACRRFGHRISEGKASYFFAIHEGKKSNENPHAQFIFVDAEKIHREVTGPRVFGTTKRGSTAKLKLVWEEVHNQVMLEAGQEATISFADARKKAMERLAEQHGIPLEPFSRPHENGLDDVEPNAPLSNVDVPREAERTLTIELPDSRHSEEDMELVAPSGAIYARTAVDALKEKRRIEQAIARRDAAKASAEAAKSASEKAVTRANDMEKNELIPLTMRQAMAEQRMKTYTTDSGLKGFEINIWGLSYKSPTRKQAEQAQHELNSAVFARDMKQRDVTEAYQMAKSVVDGAKQAATEYEIAANRFKEIVAIYGTEQEMQGAMQLFDRQAFINAREITVAQIEEAYKEASINGEEYRDLLVLKGETEKVKEWEDMQKDLGWQK